MVTHPPQKDSTMYEDLKEYVGEVRQVCANMNWKKDWSSGGCYIHLEVSEFIEALRGKGDPVDELGDILFTVLAVADFYNIDIEKAIELNKVKHSERLKGI